MWLGIFFILYLVDLKIEYAHSCPPDGQESRYLKCQFGVNLLLGLIYNLKISSKKLCW